MKTTTKTTVAATALIYRFLKHKMLLTIVYINRFSLYLERFTKALVNNRRKEQLTCPGENMFS